MPLSAHTATGQRVFAWALSSQEWLELKAATKTTPLTMSCGATAIAKTSSKGTQFFAHKSQDGCAGHAGESPEHLALKTLVAEIAERHGWTATLEERQEGGLWVADVHIERSGVRAVVEVQLARQTADQFRERTNRYLRDGVRPLWLYRAHHARSLEFVRELDGIAVVAVDPTLGEQKIGQLADAAGGWFRSLTADTLEDGLPKLLGVFHHQVPSDSTHVTAIQVSTAVKECWRCHRGLVQWEVSALALETGLGCTAWVRHSYEHMADARIEQDVQQLIGVRPGYGTYATRWTNMAGATYVALTCPHCKAVQGDNFREPAQQRETIRLPQPLDVAARAIPAHWCWTGDSAPGPRQPQPLGEHLQPNV